MHYSGSGRMIFAGALAVLITGYILLLLVIYVSQDSLLFIPSLPGRNLTATPADIGLKYLPISITTDDNELVDAWYLPAKIGHHTLLFFHGNAGNISHRLESIDIFHRLGLHVLIFDYRGYGKSSGKPSEEGTYRDAMAVWRFLVDERKVNPATILLFGRSLGGAVAAWLAGQVQAGGLIIESSFTSVPDLAAELYPWLPVRWLSKFHYNSRARLAGIHVPVLIIHSRNDEIIPFHHGQSLYAAANEPRFFLEISGGHNEGFLLAGERYYHAIDLFVKEVERRR